MTEPVASIIIPIATYHVELANRAIASAEAQTVPVEIISMLDVGGVGAGAMRNRGAVKATAPFLFWLDADDTIAPDCIERLVRRWRPRYYVYPDALIDNVRVNFPDCDQNTWKNGAVHLVSALVPLAFHDAVGGFDESLTGMEDTEYYVKMLTAGYCGIRCPEPLIHYRRRDGQRSKAFIEGENNYETLNELLVERYGRFKDMSCCGGNKGSKPLADANVPQEGDVLVEPMYAPKRVNGQATGRSYPRAGVGDRLWVARADYERMQGWFMLVSDPEAASPDFDLVKKLMSQ